MSSLNDKEIFDLIEKKQLSITPLDPNNIQPGSIDLTLGSTVDHWECSQDETLDLTLDNNKQFIENQFKTIDITDGYVLEPNDFVRGHSAETIKLPSFINGIIVIRNISHNRIKIKSGIRICQLILFRMQGDSIRNYANRHSIDSLKDFIDIKSAQVNKNIDNSLSDFMEKRIEEIASGRNK